MNVAPNCQLCGSAAHKTSERKPPPEREWLCSKCGCWVTSIEEKIREQYADTVRNAAAYRGLDFPNLARMFG